MNKNMKKLTLRTNVVRVLDASKLAGAAGGVQPKGTASLTAKCVSGNAVCESWIACTLTNDC